MRAIYTTDLNTQQMSGHMSGASVRGFMSLSCLGRLYLPGSERTALDPVTAAEPGREPKQGL